MKNLTRLFCITLLITVFIPSCNQKTETKKTTESIDKKIDLSTQQNYEKFLSDRGIVIHEKATFKELKKTSDGNYKIFYTVKPFENIQDSLQKYYEKQFDDILLSKGWAKPNDGWGPHGTEYKKDGTYFKFFIVVSDKHKIYELAFKYGQ